MEKYRNRKCIDSVFPPPCHVVINYRLKLITHLVINIMLYGQYTCRRTYGTYGVQNVCMK
jgi:hypothetical protein